MTYPTMEEVEKADRLSLGRWFRFLESPDGPDEAVILNRVISRFKEAGGWDSQLSREVGWVQSH